jgi:hypothetical protein
MTMREHIARCNVEIQNCRDAALAATTDSERYGQTWGEVDWLVAKQMYEEILNTDLLEDTDGFCGSS